MQRGDPQKQQDRLERQQQQQQHSSQHRQQAEADAMRSARMHSSPNMLASRSLYPHASSGGSGEPLTLPPLRSLDRSGALSQPRSSTSRTPSFLTLGSNTRGPSAFPPLASPSLSAHARSDSEGVTSLSHYIVSGRQPVSPASSQHSYEDEPQRNRMSEPYHREHSHAGPSMPKAHSSLAPIHHLPPPPSPVRPHSGTSAQLERSEAVYRPRQPDARSMPPALDKDTEHKLILFHSLCTDVTVFVGSLLDARHEPQPEQLRDILSRVNGAGELLTALLARPAARSPWSAHQALPSLDHAQSAAWQDAKRRRVEPAPLRSSQGAAMRLGSPPVRYTHAATSAPAVERSWNTDPSAAREQHWTRRQAPRSDAGDDYRSMQQDADAHQGESSLGVTTYPRSDWRPPADELSRPSASAAAPNGSAASYPSSSTDGDTSTSNKYRKRSRAPAPSQCASCGISETPEWRRGPDGARTVCNACGLHYAKLAKRRIGDQVASVSLEELRISIGLPEGAASGVVGPSASASASPAAARTNARTPAAAYASARAQSEAFYMDAQQSASKRRAVSQASSKGEEASPAS